MVRVKICGITNVRDARAAVRLGADALGFNFYKGSPRYITPERVRAVIAVLPPFICPVGVFVNEAPERINEIAAMCKLRAAQLHGEETPAQVDRVRSVARIKSFRVRDARDVARCRRYRAEAFLLDAFVPDQHGGTGAAFNWELARAAAEFGPVILAGGLTPENVEEAILIARPYCVDVASGVESAPGVKDKEKLADFIWRVRTIEY